MFTKTQMQKTKIEMQTTLELDLKGVYNSEQET